jgi:YHS domain-containing protein
MKTFIKCEMCDAEIPGDTCVFATHTRVIDGKEYVFCCVRCAEAFEKKKKR